MKDLRKSARGVHDDWDSANLSLAARHDRATATLDLV